MRTHPILAAVDGSDSSLAAVRHIAATVNPDRVVLRLLHVMSPRPESFWDEEVDPSSADSDAAAKNWEDDQRRRMEAFVQDARKVACDAGISKDAIRIDVQRREGGVARDMLREAQRGYDAVVLGRRGTNPAAGLPIGSVANKMAHVLHHFPVWIVAESDFPAGRVLVALDASEGARRALDHAAAMIGPQCSSLCLFHAIRGGGPGVGSPGRKDPGGADRFAALATEPLHRAERAMKIRMDGWAEQLAGRIKGSPKVVTRVVTGVPSRAGAVMKEVDSGGYGTVVIGRRGLSGVSEFAMGRVCAKVLQMAQRTAVWIVNG